MRGFDISEEMTEITFDIQQYDKEDDCWWTVRSWETLERARDMILTARSAYPKRKYRMLKATKTFEEVKV